MHVLPDNSAVKTAADLVYFDDAIDMKSYQILSLIQFLNCLTYNKTFVPIYTCGQLSCGHQSMSEMAKRR